MHDATHRDWSPEADDTDDGAWIDWPAVGRMMRVAPEQMTPEQRRRVIRNMRSLVRGVAERWH